MRHYSSTAQPTTLTADINSSVTVIPVAATTGFPATDFVLALEPGTVNQELVLVTGVAGLNLTVTRGYDSTAAVSHATGAAVVHAHGGVDFRDSRTHEAASSGVHGVTGAVVGTTDTQALSNKDLSSGNTFPGSLATDTEVAAALVTAQGYVNTHAALTSTHGVTGAIVGTTDTQTLTGKTIDLASNTLATTVAELNAAVSDGDVATLAGTETLTHKTLDLASNTLTTTVAELNAAVSDGDVATLAGAEALTNKALGAGTTVGGGPDISGAWTAFSVTWRNGLSGSTLVIGNGTLTGRYMLIGKTCFVEIIMVRGSTSNVGTTYYTWSIPFAPHQSFCGSAVFQNGSSFLAGTTAYLSASQVIIIDPSTTNRWGSSAPNGSPAAGDTMTLSFCYEIA